MIAYFSYGGKDALFTGDAGPEALIHAITTANTQGIDLRNMYVLHVPHHGSQHNLTAELINFFNPDYAFVSASSEAEKHPHPRITNAFLRRGLKIYATQGKGLMHRHNAPERTSWSSATLLPFTHQFEVSTA